MRKSKRERLEAKGWRFGSAADFLKLTPADVAYIELKLALSENLKAQRQKRHLTQKAFAKQIKSSQSRVAKMEAGDQTVSLDLLITSLLAAGTSNKELAKCISQASK